MKTYQRIMVAVDGSETANLALHEALCLTRWLKAHLCIVNVVDEFPVYNLAMNIDYERYREVVRNDGLSILKKAKHIAEKKGCAVSAKLIEIVDTNKKISETLIQAVKTDQIDLLILGTHGRRGFRRLILGSVAEETIRLSSIPILLIPAKTEMANHFINKKNSPYHRIIIGTDGSETSHLALLQAIYFAKISQAKLFILHIANEFSSKDFILAKQFIHYQDAIKHQGQDILEKSKKICQENNVTAETVMVEIKDKIEWISDKIIEAIDSLEADLLVIGTHGRSGINRFLLGSIAEETIRKAPIPVLLVRPKINI